MKKPLKSAMVSLALYVLGTYLTYRATRKK